VTAPDVLTQLQAGIGDEYRVERELGGGGMSRVFLAEETRLGRRVVLKVLNPQLGASVSSERFEREIRVAAQLQDPRIVPLLTAGHTAALSYYTMPFVEGESLRARLHRGPMPLGEATSVLRDIALALDYAHAHGVVHRDIKPENVLVTHGTAVVTDFGIAKAITAATGADSQHTMTGVGIAVGTPAYMAPEQAAGDAVDGRADIYAWGVIAYEMLTGTHPFASHSSVQAIIAAHISEEPVPVRTRAPHIPRPLSELIDRTLAKTPSRRPDHAADLVRLIDEVAGSRRRVGSGQAVRIAVGIAALGLILAGGLALRRHHPPSSTPHVSLGTTAPRSIAVIPFVSADGDSSNAYIGSGMAEELTTAFARVPGIRVASQASASRFDASRASAADIARELKVETILTGTVRRAGDRIRVTARLVDPKDGTILWTDKFDRQMAQVFDVQDEMAHAIVAALRPTFVDTAALAAARVARGTEDLLAYDLYLKGRYYWTRRGESGLLTANDYFKQALSRDSTFARAWAGLSMVQVVLPVFASLRADSVVPLASQSAQRALALDSTLSDARLAWAYALKTEWRWRESEEQFKRALVLAPNDATVHHWYGVLLYVTGRMDESVAELRRAMELDPVAIQIGTDLFYGLYLARHYDEALVEGRRFWAMDTTKADAALQLGMIDLALARPDSALAAFDKSRRLGVGFDLRAFASVANRRLGRAAVADSLYGALVADYKTDRSLAYAVAIAASGAGDLQRGMSAINETIDRRSAFVTEISLACDPVFDPLKRDPRFSKKLAEVGLKACAPDTLAPAIRPL
jgi:serine/threonine-protein kinase